MQRNESDIHQQDFFPAGGASAHHPSAWLQDFKPALVLVYLSLMGTLCILGAQKYLGLKPNVMSCITFMGIIFGVYTLNRFTDTAEDFTNDLHRLLFFQKQQAFLLLAGAALAGTTGYLAYQDKLTWMHILLLGTGFSYSFRMIPWYNRAKGLHLVRIKEIIFLKNLTVSFLWGASIFVIPILNFSPIHYDGFMIWMLAAGLFLSTLNNTLFDDILDEAGDRVAGIKTLPTTWGAKKSQIMLISLDIAWILSVLGVFVAGRIDMSHAAFLAFIGFYPFIYMGLNKRGGFSKGWIDFLSESDLLLYGLGLFALSFL